MTLTPRQFGVEIEVGGISIAQAGAALQQNGTSPSVSGTQVFHRHTTPFLRDTWKVTYDVTVSAEVVSPPLRDTATVEEVMRCLRGAGARTDRRCGLHVHVDMANGQGQPMDLAALKRLAKLWLKIEGTVFGLVSASRRTSRWCHRLARRFQDSVAAHSRIDGARSPRELFSVCGGTRYMAMNLARTLQSSPTIEFRLHQGSLNFRKVDAWIRLCVAIVEAAQRGVEVQPNQRLDDVLPVEDMLRLVFGTSVSQPSPAVQRRRGNYRNSRRGAMWAYFDTMGPSDPNLARGAAAAWLARNAAANLGEPYTYAIQQVSGWRNYRLTANAAAPATVPADLLRFFTQRFAHFGVRPTTQNQAAVSA
jgi:hypothetical protein